jgi:hypothetical protein
MVDIWMWAISERKQDDSQMFDLGQNHGRVIFNYWRDGSIWEADNRYRCDGRRFSSNIDIYTVETERLKSATFP